MLIAYAKEHVPEKRSAKNIAYTISNLQGYWGAKRLAEVTAQNCREYGKDRTRSAARRDLETLRAAIGHWHREYGPLGSIPAVTLPPKSESRELWLTREEARRLRRAAMGVPHLYRFIVIALLTGSRSGAILNAKWSWVNLSTRTMLRRAPGEAQDAKKRTPQFRMGEALTRLLRRWRRFDAKLGDVNIVHFEGREVKKLRRSWLGARRRAGLTGVTPHTLRHTRATWMMQAKVDPWEAAGALGMSVETLTRTYGKHHPDWQKDAAEV